MQTWEHMLHNTVPSSTEKTKYKKTTFRLTHQWTHDDLFLLFAHIHNSRSVSSSKVKGVPHAWCLLIGKNGQSSFLLVIWSASRKKSIVIMIIVLIIFLPWVQTSTDWLLPHQKRVICGERVSIMKEGVGGTGGAVLLVNCTFLFMVMVKWSESAAATRPESRTRPSAERRLAY